MPRNSSFCRWALTWAFAVLGAGMMPSLLAQASGDATRVLTTLREIRAMPSEVAAQGMPVRIRGIVTRATPFELFIQEGPDAIFVWQRTSHQVYQLGDYVEITGTTHSGHLFPIIKEQSISVLEHRALPEPHRVRYHDLATGREDCQWVEVEGVVRNAEERPGGDLSLRIVFDGASLRVEVNDPRPIVFAQLIGARLRLRGVVGGSKIPQRQMLDPVLWVMLRPETFIIETPAPADVFSVPIQKTNTLLAYRDNSFSSEMARVRGVVIGQPLPNLVFVRDEGRNIEIRLQRPITLVPGDTIEAVGFPEMGAIQPILESALARRLTPGSAPVPVRVEAGRLLDFKHEAELIAVEGELRELARPHSGLTLVVAENGVVFSADLDALPANAKFELPPVGSRLALVGICQIDRLTPPNVSGLVTPASVRLRLRSLGDLQVTARPPWWTARRLLVAIGILSAFVLGALALIWSLNRRVRAQTQIILGNVQKEAMLEERNRIAREFHDTLEQQLAGATILLDAIATVVAEQPARAREGLATARAMLRVSLDEAQDAVSDLRNNDLFERDLGPLIEDSVRERLGQSEIEVDFRQEGTWPEMDPVVKKHILRIVQECVTNVVKHAAPTRLSIAMFAARDRVELHVVDNGCGFEADGLKQPGAGKFGLIGMRERAEKIGANLTIQSSPQRGTTIVLALRVNGATGT